jgi:pyridoxine 5-phosphate synthase
MSANEEIIGIALQTLPDLVTIVPEKRQELTTEGGLDVAGDIPRFKDLVERMHEKKIEVSFFVEPDKRQIDAVLNVGGDMCEFHTGIYANLKNEKAIKSELKKIRQSAFYASKNALKVAAGHGLNYSNTYALATIPNINELSIGHSIISRAIFVGMERAVKEMQLIIWESSKIAMLEKSTKEDKM